MGDDNLFYTVGDMFAGVGGIALGFMQAGFKVKWSNEYDKNACKTYRYNFPTHKLYENDVKELDPKELGYVDVIVSGFPCQAFSLAGHRKGFKDPRGNLFFETARFIEELQPKAYLLENVRNLRGHDGGKTFRIIRETLEDELGYSFIYFILNSCEYGNVPQNRERIYIIGFKNEAGFCAGDQIQVISKKGDSLTTNFRIPKKISLVRSINDIVFNKEQENKYYFADDHKYIPELKKVIKSRDTLYQWRRVYVRENKNNLCPTLTANMGAGGHNVPLLIDDKGFRKLVPKECFKFQGFPEEYELPKDMADSHLYKQAGNSVVVPIIKRIALEINRVLSDGRR